MNKWIYSETVKDHFFNPRNILLEDKGYKADGVGEVGSPACGDVMKVFIKVDRKKDLITEMKWKTFGCASAIGSTSMLSVMINENGGTKIEEALKITPSEIMKRLGGLPKNKIHCSVLGDKALRAAIYDYFKKSGQEERIEGNKTRSKIICSCLGVTEREVLLNLAKGAKTFEDIQKITKAGTGCGKCIPKIKKFIKDHLKDSSKYICQPRCSKCPCPHKNF